jgi:hypothetical protein
MDTGPQDFRKWIQDLAARTSMEWLHAAQRYSAFGQRVASGELDQRQLRDESIRFARDETDYFIRNLTSLSLSYYNSLIELGRTFNPPLFDQALAAAPTARSVVAATTLPRVQLALRGVVGQDAIGSFVVNNQHSEPDEVSFVVSEFTGEIGAAAFRPPLALQPPRFTLGPHEQRNVALKLPLLKDLFAPQQHYTAAIKVQRRDPFEIGVDVVADSSAE